MNTRASARCFASSGTGRIDDESFDADAAARELATMRAEMKRDDDEGRVALTRERERIEARESEVRASTREKRRVMTMRAWMNE